MGKKAAFLVENFKNIFCWIYFQHFNHKKHFMFNINHDFVIIKNFCQFCNKYVNDETIFIKVPDK